MTSEPRMEITLHNRQRKVRFSLERLQRLAPLALERCVADPEAQFPSLDEVEVTFVSDATISRVHKQFMNIPGPTDVITFDHGEIVIGAETAQAYAAASGKTLEEELALYIVHGLLHLAGYDDREPEAAARMHRTQERILSACLARS